MRWINQYTRWFEQHWVTPSYGGWVIIGLTSCFWLAAANTLAGWLYVLSGICLALLLLSAWFPLRLLKGITAQRHPLYPVSVGETLSLTVELARSMKGPFFLQCQDQLPDSFERIPWHTLEWPNQKTQYRWNYGVIPQKRGHYHWQTLILKTAAPLGLLSCERRREAPVSVLVYPSVIPLTHCPILDQFAATQALIPDQHHSNQLGQDGTTRSLRPYRHGDARRLIHWRSSAKFNELRTRELEVIAGENPVVIALNSGELWSSEAFESAVTTAASLYQYAQKRGLAVDVWTAGAGLQQRDIPVLETLAVVTAGETEVFDLPSTPILWLTESTESLVDLPNGSLSILWQADHSSTSSEADRADLVITPRQPLSTQLQATFIKRS